MLFAKRLNLSPDVVADFADARQLLLMGARELRRIRKRPVQTLRRTGEDRAAFGVGLAANGDHMENAARTL